MAVHPGGSNTYVANHEASGSLVVNYSRNPDDFAFNQYVSVAPCTQDSGYYLKIDAANSGRVIDAAGADFVWPDGNDEPTGTDNLQQSDFSKFATIRRAFPFRIGNKAVDQATWDIVASHGAMAAQQAMTVRSQLAATLVSTASNYGSNTGTATALAGDKWSASSSTNNYVKKSLNAAAKAILKATLGRVKPTDLCLIINPDVAEELSTNPEILDYYKANPITFAALQGDGNTNEQYGLPPKLFGYKLVVEDAVRTTTKKGASTQTQSFVLGGTVAALVARVGALDAGVVGAPTFSTITCFEYENMTAETKDDPDNRRVKGRVVDDIDVEMTASASGYLITAVL